MQSKGFSLIELMCALLIIGILASFSYPMFQESITRSRRIDGQTALIDLANRMEAFFAENHSYEGATLGTGAESDILPANRSSQGWYILTISQQTAKAFSLQASPVKAQALNDKACQSFGLSSTGVRTIAAGPAGQPTAKAENCW